MQSIQTLGLFVLTTIFTSGLYAKDPAPTNKVVLSKDIQWQYLNPARGDKSPQAGTVWGDIRKNVASGYIGKFKDGFVSPPHIHNVTYRAIVISGSIHNDDPDAKPMWMPAGSFWSQPAGKVHITAAKGQGTTAYIEIDAGPYLVWSPKKAFDNGEQPINIDSSNMQWLDASKTKLIDSSAPEGTQIAFLWNKKGIEGLLVKLPKGFKGNILSEGSIFRTIVIGKGIDYSFPTQEKPQELKTTNSFSSEGASTHIISAKEGTLLYIRTNGSLLIK